MSLSQAEIALVLEEIAPRCGRSTLQRVLEPRGRTLVFRLREPGETLFLLVSTQQNETRLHFIDEKPEQPGHPSPFAMQLRKWLHGAPLEEVRQINDDRVVEFTFLTVDPRVERPDGDDASPERAPAYLICELAGRVGNVYLLDSNRHVVGKQTGEAIASRDFAAGDEWTPPPPPPDPEIGSDVRWGLESLSPDTFERSETIDAHYSKRRKQRRRDVLLGELESELEDQRRRLDRRIEHVEEDLRAIENADKYRKWAELLQSAYGKVDKGAESVTVPDFYQDEMPEVEIELDPSKSLQENIDHYYHEAQRYDDARDMVEERLLRSIEKRDRTVDELDRLRSESSWTADELEAFRSRLLDHQLIREKEQAPSNKRIGKPEETRPYRTFRAESGRQILVGRGPSENDTLSTKIARGRDVWFHTRDWPGAHVLLRMDHKDESPQTEELLDAATLAAHFSKRSDTVVDVSYTRAKHVRKHGDLPPGRVFIANESTIAVKMEEERLERLLESEEV